MEVASQEPESVVPVPPDASQFPPPVVEAPKVALPEVESGTAESNVVDPNAAAASSSSAPVAPEAP